MYLIDASMDVCWTCVSESSFGATAINGTEIEIARTGLPMTGDPLS